MLPLYFLLNVKSLDSEKSLTENGLKLNEEEITIMKGLDRVQDILWYYKCFQ